MYMLVIKNITNKTMYIVQELHAFIFNGIAFNGIASNGTAFKWHFKSHYKAFHFH